MADTEKLVLSTEMKLKELATIAGEKGVSEPERFRAKADVIAAIVAKVGEDNVEVVDKLPDDDSAGAGPQAGSGTSDQDTQPQAASRSFAEPEVPRSFKSGDKFGRVH